MEVEDKAAKAAEEEEIDDENWTDLERFQHFARSQHPLRRLVCIRGLPDLLASLTVNEAIDSGCDLLCVQFVRERVLHTYIHLQKLACVYKKLTCDWKSCNRQTCNALQCQRISSVV